MHTKHNSGLKSHVRTMLLIGLFVVLGTAVFTSQLQASPPPAQEQANQITATPSSTPTETATPTLTASPTATNTITPTATISGTVTITPTPTMTPTGSSTPDLTVTPTPTITSTPDISPGNNLVYLPIILLPEPAPLLVPIRVSATPPIDFEAAREDAQSQGLDIAFNKIGFHVGLGGNRNGLDAWMEELDAAGVPFMLKSANNAEPLFEAQQIMDNSDTPHILVYRDARSVYDIPAYNLPPDEAAEISWDLNKSVFPPELDPTRVWIETTNEPDKNKTEWLAQFALQTAELAVADGYKYAAFGWASGEPEIEDWESEAMLAFLQFAGEHPDQVALSLHEYSYETNEIGRLYPWLLGRFQKIFEICDEHDIPRPTVLITEWGWEYNHVPEPDPAMEDIAWASWMYANYPQVKGVATWYLGYGDQFGNIHNETQKLIAPVKDYSLSNYFIIDPDERPIDTTLLEPNPPTRIKIERFK